MKDKEYIKKNKKNLTKKEKQYKVLKYTIIGAIIIIVLCVVMTIIGYYQATPLQREFPFVESMTTETSTAAQITSYSTDKYIMVTYEHGITPETIFKLLKKIKSMPSYQPLEQVVMKENSNSEYAYTAIPSINTTVFLYGELSSDGITLKTPAEYKYQMDMDGIIFRNNTIIKG